MEIEKGEGRMKKKIKLKIKVVISKKDHNHLEYLDKVVEKAAEIEKEHNCHCTLLDVEII